MAGLAAFPAVAFLAAGLADFEAVFVLVVLADVALGLAALDFVALGAALALLVLPADFLLLGPFAALAAISSSASSSVMSSGDRPLGRVALILPWRA